MEEKFDLWAIVELMGHSKIAGRCSEQSIAGSNMLRVDVPENEQQPTFTKFYNGSAVYAINPVTESVAVEYSKKLVKKPLEVWDINAMVAKLKLLPQAESSENLFFEDSDNDGEDDN